MVLPTILGRAEAQIAPWTNAFVVSEMILIISV
jgi:hypothetical protein